MEDRLVGRLWGKCHVSYVYLFKWASRVAPWERSRLPVQETEAMCVRSLGQEHPLEKGMATHSSILPGESCEQRSLAGCGP